MEETDKTLDLYTYRYLSHSGWIKNNNENGAPLDYKTKLGKIISSNIIKDKILSLEKNQPIYFSDLPDELMYMSKKELNEKLKKHFNGKVVFDADGEHFCIV